MGVLGVLMPLGRSKKKKKNEQNEQNMAKNKINKTAQKNSGASPRGEPCESLRPTPDDAESTSAGAFVHPPPGSVAAIVLCDNDNIQHKI